MTQPSFAAVTDLAFPGAQGFGSRAAGARGCSGTPTIKHVSTTAELIQALETRGPRIVVFDKGGVYEIPKIRIQHPCITVLGNTAPANGDGVVILANTTSDAIEIDTHNVIFRYIRFRYGLKAGEGVKNSAESNLLVYDRGDDGGVRDVMIDHSSFTWGVDDNLGVGRGAKNVTVQNSIFGEAVYCNGELGDCTGDRQQVHSKGVVVINEKAGDISVHHNLFIRNTERNPLITGVGSGVVDVANNILFDNWRQISIDNRYGWASGRRMKVNIVNNLIMKGEAHSFHARNKSGRDEIKMEISTEACIKTDRSDCPGTRMNTLDVFVQGNVGWHDPEGDSNRDLLDASLRSSEWGHQVIQSQPVPIPDWAKIAPESAQESATQLLTHIGPSYPRYDKLDQRLINETLAMKDESQYTGPSKFVHVPSESLELSGMNRNIVSNYTAGEWSDRDGDGLPDDFEEKYPGKSFTDVSESGYYLVEEWAHNLASDGRPNPTAPPSPAPTDGTSGDADYNNDGRVDIVDFSSLITYFRQENCRYNLTNDCVIDVFDYSELLRQFTVI